MVKKIDVPQYYVVLNLTLSTLSWGGQLESDLLRGQNSSVLGLYINPLSPLQRQIELTPDALAQQIHVPHFKINTSSFKRI